MCWLLQQVKQEPSGKAAAAVRQAGAKWEGAVREAGAMKIESNSEKYQSMLRGLLAPERLFISFSRSPLSWDGATRSNNPICSGISPRRLTFLYLRQRAIAIRSSSGETLPLAASLSLMMSRSCSLSNSGGSTMSRMSSMRDCLMISSMRQSRSREGEELISIRWQLLSVSIMTSQPKSSKAAGKGGTETEQPSRDLMMIQWTCAQMALKEQSMLASRSLRALREILLPPEKCADCLASWLFLLTAKLVRWTKAFFIIMGSRENFSVLRRANPSRQTKASRGWKLVTRTQMRKSNLQPSRRRGLVMYFWTTMLSMQFSSARLLTTLMPRPLDLPIGFMIQQLRSRLSSSSSWNLMLNWVYSLGRLKVSGRKGKGTLSILRKASRFLQSRSFRDRFLLKGKWFIRCHTSNLLMSMSGLLQDQNKFQLDRSEHPRGSSFHPFRRRNPVLMMSYTSSFVFTTRQYRWSPPSNSPCRLLLKVSIRSTIFFRFTYVPSVCTSSYLGSATCSLLFESKGRKIPGWKQELLPLKWDTWELKVLISSLISEGISCSAWCSDFVYITEKMWLNVGQISRQSNVGSTCRGFGGATTVPGTRFGATLRLCSFSILVSSFDFSSKNSSSPVPASATLPASLASSFYINGSSVASLPSAPSGSPRSAMLALMARLILSLALS